MKGVVTKVLRDRGYAFIRGEDGVSRFVHATAVEDSMFDTLFPGTEVEFTPVIHGKGERAINVRRLIGDRIERV